MKSPTAGDMMIPLDEYPVVDASATVLDAVMRLSESRRSMESRRQPFQAVLVADGEGKIIGKLGQLAILKGLEPNRQIFGDERLLERAGVSHSIIRAALDNIRPFQTEFPELCKKAAALPVRLVMHPFKEHIDIGASINETIHRMVEWQTLSILVTRNNQPAGLVRLSDLCDEIIAEMHRSTGNRQADSGRPSPP
jgi:hypothetical protein